MRMNPVITVHGTKLGESKLAVRFRVERVRDVVITPTEQWFPLSQVSKLFTHPTEPGEDYLVVSEWIMTQKSLPLNPKGVVHEQVKSQTHLSRGHFDSYEDIDPDDIPF